MGELAAWRYCPRCRTELSGDDARRECPSCGFVAYASSNPTASALLVDDSGRVLLSRRRYEPYAGQWDLPGGFLAEGEHPLDALQRELREEASVEIEAGDFLGIWMDRYGDGAEAPATINLYWTARITAGEPQPDDDVLELRWFDPDDLPPADEIAFHVTQVLSAWRDEHA